MTIIGAPKTLTRAEFGQTAAAKKPGASYQGYLSYVRKRRGNKMGPSAPLGSDFSGLIGLLGQQVMSPTQMQKYATQSVQEQIAAQQAAERATTSAAQLQARNQASRAQGFALALANATGRTGDEALAAYQNAGDRLRAYGTGLTDTVAQAQQAAVDQATAKVREMRGEGQATALDVPALRSAATYQGVTLPGTSLEEQALLAQRDALSARRADVGQLGTVAQDYLQKTTDLQKELALKQQAINAQRPALLREQLQSLQERQGSVLNQLIQAQYLGSSIRQSGAEITGRDPLTGKPTMAAQQLKQQQAQYLQDYNEKVRQFNKSLAADQEKAALPNAELSGRLGYLADANGNPILMANGQMQILPGYQIKGGRIVKTNSKSKPKSLTQKQMNDYKADAEAIAEDAFSGAPAEGKNAAITQTDWEGALQRMRRFGIPMTIALPALRRWYKPGERGRPAVAVGPTGSFGVQGVSAGELP